MHVNCVPNAPSITKESVEKASENPNFPVHGFTLIRNTQSMDITLAV